MIPSLSDEERAAKIERLAEDRAEEEYHERRHKEKQAPGILFVGTDGEQVVNSSTTKQQIKLVRSFECALEHNGEEITWRDLDNPEQPRTIFQSIMRDRELRVDRHTLMADRPAFAVVTTLGNKAVRLEYYEGHDALKQVFDLRSRELEGKKLPDFMDEDPQAYDPSKFLKDAFGIPEDVSKPILEEVHRKEED